MGHVCRTKVGSWQARYRDPRGRERARSFPRRIDAERFLTLIEAEKLRGEWVDPEAGKVTVAEFSERWYATTTALKPKTRAGYRVIHAVFGLAQQASLITRNPVEGTKTPPLPVGERRLLTPDQVQQLATSMAGRYEVLTYVLAYAGIRFGEAAALRRSRCDVARSRLHISESLAEVAGDLHFGPTKTHRRRTVVMPATIRDLLVKHLDTVEQRPETLVFTSPTGRPIRYSNFRNRVWVPATEAAGLHGLDIHELRHTATSLMIRTGADPKLIQTQLGHASIAITYDVYGHLFPDRLDELADQLNRLILERQECKPSHLRARDRDDGLGRSI